MKNKTEIRYWLIDGEEETDIVGIPTSKVPEVGEVINFGHHWDEDRANRVYEHLDDAHKKAFFPKKEKLITGEYVVVSVNRYITIDYVKTKVSEVFEGVKSFSNSTNYQIVEIPTLNTIEVFEVFIEKFKHSELTETPIAKVRNLLGSLFGTFDMISLIAENPDKEKEILELLKGHIEDAKEPMTRLREIIGDDKNWK